MQSEAVTTTSLKTFFKFPFQGPDWRSRFIVGAALMFAGFLIPVLPTIFVYGYILQVMRQAIKGEDLGLPAWDDWGRMATDGLRLMFVGLVYCLPGMLVFFGGMILYFASSFAFPLAMVSAEEGSGVPLQFPLLLLASMAIMFLSTLIGSGLFVLGAIPLPMAASHFAAQDRVAAAFRVREWFPLLRTNKLGYFIDWVIVMGLMGISYFAIMMAYSSVILCCFIPFLGAPASFYMSLVGAALFGHTYRESAALPSSGD